MIEASNRPAIPGRLFPSSMQVSGPRRSFTLVEVLVALTILGLLLVLLFSFTGQVTKVWQHGLAGAERHQNNRATIDFMGKELQFAVLGDRFHGTNAMVRTAWRGMTASISPLQFVIDPPSVASATSSSVFWQAPVGTGADTGGLAEVGYCVSWSTNRSSCTGVLRRFFVNPSDTVRYLVYAQTNWIGDALLNQVAPADEPHNYRGLLAENVYALWVRALDAYGNPILTNASASNFNPPYGYDSRQGYIDSQGGIHPPGSLPAMVEIALVVSDARTTRMLSRAYPAAAFRTSPVNFQSDIDTYVSTFPPAVRAGIHVYSTRVALDAAH